MHVFYKKNKMSEKCSFVLVCVWGFVATVFAQTTTPKVTTSEGLVQGQLVADGNYFGYYGLHYGGATEGNNRFKAPTPPPIYPGEYSALDANIVCAQPSPRGLIGVENCLTLNVFTNNTDTKKPVVVWLNGEEYSSTIQYTPSFKRFIQSNIVVVSLNYRLSIFGFLCLGVEQAPGNAGLKDVIQGLQWVKKNINGFGGDPNNVVLLGHGSGAAMADIVTMSPLAKDLVHKAIVLSGSALAPWAISYNPVRAAENLGVSLGYTGKTKEELASLIQTTDLSVLISALNTFSKSYNNTPMFAPCIEDAKITPNNTVLVDSPRNILRNGNFNDIPYIAGYTNKEGTARADMAAFYGWLPKMQENFTNFLPVDINYNAAPNKTALESSIREYYFAKKAIDMDTIEDYLAYHGDTMTLISVINGAKERALNAKSDVRLFEFAYRGTYNSDWPYTQIALTGVKHGGILNYIFDYDLRPNDANVRLSLMTRITTFITTGTPTGITRSTVWPAITNSSVNYLYYGGDDGIIGNLATVYVEENRFNPHQQRISFWGDIYSKYYKAPSSVSSASIINISLFLTVMAVVVQVIRL